MGLGSFSTGAKRDALRGGADGNDSYPLHAPSMMSHGSSMDEAALYLADMVSKRMGLSGGDTSAATATAQAIADTLVSLPIGPLT